MRSPSSGDRAEQQSPRPRVVAFVSLLTASLLAGGCTSTATPAETDSSAVAPPSSSSTPAEAPVATPSDPPTTPSPPASPPRLPAFESLTVTPQGLGSLIIGQPLTTTDMVVWDPDACESYETYPPGDPQNGRWIANYDAPEGSPPFAMAPNDDETVGAVEIRSDSLATAEGIRLGSTLEDLRESYPQLVDLAAGDLSTLHALDEGSGRITFEVVHSGDYWPEFAGRVAVMRIVAVDAPAPLVVATDAVLGSCL